MNTGRQTDQVMLGVGQFQLRAAQPLSLRSPLTTMADFRYDMCCGKCYHLESQFNAGTVSERACS